MLHDQFRVRLPAWLIFASLFGAAVVKAELNCNAGIEFHEEGGIKRCNLNGYHTLYTHQGVRVVCADRQWLEQFPGGQLRSCVVSEKVTAANQICDPGQRVVFDLHGALKECLTLSRP